MKKTALVIMAAGIGSRFGKGIKQLEPVGLHGEIIMDYSIHDALEAGFNKVVFILRRDLEQDFKEIIGRRIEKIAEVAYAYQSLTDIPDGYEVPKGRVKPWGTGQAVLAAADVIHEPFVVINADDYYGKDSFVKAHDYLIHADAKNGATNVAMVGFVLKNTLSDNGGVTRGVCTTDADGNLLAIDETSNIIKTKDGAAVQSGDTLRVLDADAPVSMNMWGMQPEFLRVLKDGFVEFFEHLSETDAAKKEYLLPIYIDELLQAGKVCVRVLHTDSTWFGVTYQEDKEIVSQAFKRLIEQKVYGERLFG